MPNFLERRNKLREIFASTSNAALFFDAVSIRYLSGFSGSNSALLIGTDAKDDFLLTDERYTKRAKDEAIDIKIAINRDFFSIIKSQVTQLKLSKIAIDPKLLTFAQAEFIQKDLNLELVKFKDFLSPLRMIKDEYEIKQIRKACAITADTLWFLINDLRPGMNEKQIARLLQEGFLKRGADGLAFSSIVASGINSATPHHEPSNRVLERGDMVTIDCGALVNGYHADMTRTVFIGTCADWQKEIYDTVMNAQMLGRKKLKIGVSAEEVDQECRKYIEEANFGSYFVHGTGHGVGLEIHEPMFLAKEVKTKLSSGNCVTVEPGIYLPEKGGVRIEDTCLVTDGEAEVLTPGSHEIICVA